MIRVVNAPCSWGVIENLTGETAGYRQFLAAHADLRAEICDAILPKPDREKAGPEP